MTTDTPSVEHECLRVVDGGYGWHVQCRCGREFSANALERAVDAYTLHIVEFIRVGAIRERDEAREALREGVGLLKDALYGGLLKPDEEMPPVSLCWVCGAGVETATDHFDGCFVPRLAAFLARFPEGGEG